MTPLVLEQLTSLKHYFPQLTERQQNLFAELAMLYQEWNSKINVISRKDIDNVVTNHILHSLAIAKFISFREGTRIFDIGTGGGLPGIPLAILFPECHFTLIDSIGKKITVASSIVEALGLKHVIARQSRAESITERCDFVVSRAAMGASDLMTIARRLVDTKASNNAMPNGLIALKGGDLQAELHLYRHIAMVEELNQYFAESHFKTKKIVYIPL